MSELPPQKLAIELVDQASFEFVIGNETTALAKLKSAVDLDPLCFEAWLAMAEINFALRQLNEALSAGEQALALRPKDIHAHTSLSRIWLECGDKTKAEYHGTQARILGWGDQIKESESKQHP